MFSEESYAKLEAAAYEAFVEKRIPMKRGNLGLWISHDRYVLDSKSGGCCITAAVVLNERVQAQRDDPRQTIDDAYTLAGHKLGVEWSDINALWMVWDYLMAPEHSLPTSREDIPVRDRVKTILDRLVENGAQYSTENKNS